MNKLGSIDVVTASRRREVTSAEIKEALVKAGHSARLRETYVVLSPRIPAVDGKGVLSFYGFMYVDAGFNVARWSDRFTGGTGALTVRLEGLTTGVTYAVALETGAISKGPNPQFELAVSAGTAVQIISGSATQTMWVTAKPDQTLVVPITPKETWATVDVFPHQLDLWTFYKATVFV